MLVDVLDVLLIAVPILGFVNRRKPWGRRLAYVSTAILVIAYSTVPVLRHHMAQGFREGYNWAAF